MTMTRESWLEEYQAHVNAFNEFRVKGKDFENYETIKSLLGDAAEYLYKLGGREGYYGGGMDD